MFSGTSLLSTTRQFALVLRTRRPLRPPSNGRGVHGGRCELLQRVGDSESDDGTCAQAEPALEITRLADGNCNFDPTSGWYQVFCNRNGVFGKSSCDSDDCSSCTFTMDAAWAMPTDESCFTRKYWSDFTNMTSASHMGNAVDEVWVDLKFKGTCTDVTPLPPHTRTRGRASSATTLDVGATVAAVVAVAAVALL